MTRFTFTSCCSHSHASLFSSHARISRVDACSVGSVGGWQRPAQVSSRRADETPSWSVRVW
eukprot:1750473-Rhodomonas_salina.1